MTPEQFVVGLMALAWIVATVRGIRRLDAQEAYRARRDALASITQQEER